MLSIDSIGTTAQLLRTGNVTAVDLVERCLSRIDRFDAEYRAWVTVDASGALEAARRLDDEAAGGNWRGPLHGIPIGIKDIIDVAGAPTLAGSRLRAGDRADRDATLVARLRTAGAIVLGKTVTTEFACFDPSPTRNPWNLAHTPGGSSSGSAAAVALGMCYAAVGSQTGGSITRPASYCGVCGSKPTWGRVSLDGVVPVSFHLDHPGPIARSVADLAIMLDAMAGFDPRDPFSVDVPTEPYTAHLSRERPPRLALVGEFFHDEADEAMRDALARAVDVLRDAGAEIVAANLPGSFDDVHEMHRRIMAVEAAECHQVSFATHRAEYGPQVRGLIEAGLDTSAVDYAAALAHQFGFHSELRAMFVDCDALLMAATPAAAPARIDTTGDPRFNSPWSFAGVPTVSLPCSLSPEGMPLALQLVGPRFSEAPLHGVAAWCERQLKFDHLPPPLAASAGDSYMS